MNLNFKAKPPHPYILAFGVFLVFVGVRIHLIMVHGSQTPYWDDWAMGTRMAMYMESGFDPTWLYGLSNEHRAAFSKITNLLLFKLNHHQWDPYLTMVFNTFVWGASGLFLIYIGFREKSKINPWLFSSLVVVLWTYPLSLFNILSTIQTYLYYMILFVVCGFWLVTCKAFSLKWCCGMLLIAAACITTGGGSFAPVAVTAVSCFLAVLNKQGRTQHLITTGIAGVFAIFGMYLILSQGGGPGIATTKSLSTFFISLFKTLSWPSSDRVWPSIIFLLPIGLLALGIARKKIEQSRLATFTLMMAAFGVMLSIAIAYARGMDGSGPAERYFDFLTIYLVSSTLALMLIQGSALKFQRVFNRSLAVLWIIMCIAAIPYHLSVSRFSLNDRANLVPVQDDIMARYSVTSDPKIFQNRAFRQVPFPSAKILQDMMKRLNKTDTLPYSLQSSSMALQVEDNAFIVDGIAKPHDSRYRGLERVLGSFNLNSGAQNAMGEYTSEVFVAKRPYLMIPVSGYLGSKGTSLTLVGEDNGKIVDIAPKALSPSHENQWREILVIAPDKRFRIVARDESPQVWFAYAAPRSVGRLSYLVDRIIKNSDKIWVFGLLLLIVAFRHQIVSLAGFRVESKACA